MALHNLTREVALGRPNLDYDFPDVCHGCIRPLLNLPDQQNENLFVSYFNVRLWRANNEQTNKLSSYAIILLTVGNGC